MWDQPLHKVHGRIDRADRFKRRFDTSNERASHRRGQRFDPAQVHQASLELFDQADWLNAVQDTNKIPSSRRRVASREVLVQRFCRHAWIGIGLLRWRKRQACQGGPGWTNCFGGERRTSFVIDVDAKAFRCEIAEQAFQRQSL